MFHTRKKIKGVLKNAGSPRPKEDGGSERVYTIDNRRGSAFGGYVHDHDEIVTAAALWRQFKRKIDLQEMIVEALASSNFSSIFKRVCDFSDPVTSYNNNSPILLSDDFNRTERNPISLTSQTDRVIPTKHNIPKKEFLDFYTPPLDLSPYLKSYLDIYRFEKPFDEATFQNRSRWRLTSGANEVPEGWDELQQSLEPSLSCEDCLGSFETWMENFPKDTQFLLMGDTHHYKKDIRAWLTSDKYLKTLQNAGITDVVLELPVGLKTAFNEFFLGTIDKKQLLEHLKQTYPKGFWAKDFTNFAEHAKHHGIRVHALDEQVQIMKPSKNPAIMFNRMDHDARLAQKIKEAVGDRKTAIIYGAAHFRYRDTLIELLGAEKSRIIDIYADLKDFKNSPTQKGNAKHPAPYAFLIGEDTVVGTYGHYNRTTSPAKDFINSATMMGQQEREVEKFLQRFKEEYPNPFDPKLYGVTPQDFLMDIFWHRRAKETQFKISQDCH